MIVLSDQLCDQCFFYADSALLSLLWGVAFLDAYIFQLTCMLTFKQHKDVVVMLQDSLKPTCAYKLENLKKKKKIKSLGKCSQIFLLSFTLVTKIIFNLKFLTVKVLHDT